MGQSLGRSFGPSFRLPFEIPKEREYLWACLVGVALGVATMVSPLVSVVLIVGLTITNLVLARPVLLCYMLIPVIVMTAGMPRGRLIPIFQPNELIVFFALAMSYLIFMVRKPRRGVVPVPIVLALTLYVLGMVILPTIGYIGWRGYRLTISEIFALFGPLQNIFLWWLFRYLPGDERDRQRLVQWMLLWGMIISIFGLLQAARIGFITNIINTYYPNVQTTAAAELGRTTSLLAAWNDLGTFLMTNILLIIALQSHKHTLLYKLNMLCALILAGACLLASGSFASAGGMVMGIGIIKLMDRRGLRTILLLALGLGVAAFILQDLLLTRLEYQYRSAGGGVVPETFAYRLIVWEKIYLPLVMRNLFTGVQPTMHNITWQWAESQYIYLLFRSGLLSLIGHLLWVIISAAWFYRRFKRTEGTQQALSVTLFALFVVLSIMGFTNEVFTLTGSAKYMWMMLGLASRD